MMDLLCPPGFSVNDATDKRTLLYGVHHGWTDGASGDAAGRRNSDGESRHWGTYLLLLIHAEVRPLLGVWWESSVYRMLCSHLACDQNRKYLIQFADALQWLLEQQGVENMDYLLSGWLCDIGHVGHATVSPGTVQDSTAICFHSGVPLAVHKMVGSTVPRSWISWGSQPTQ